MNPNRCMSTIVLTASQWQAINALLTNLQKTYALPDAPAFLAEVRTLAFSHLPIELVQFLNCFRRTESSAVVAVEGFEIDDDKIGPTPLHWNAQPNSDSTLREEFYFMLLGSLLGDTFGWITLQGGRLIHNVLPTPGQEQEQNAHGSIAALAWHTEDGFHPYRCDYLGLMGLRNMQNVPTVISSIDSVHLTDRQQDVLFEPRYVINPDNEHLCQRSREALDTDNWCESLMYEWRDPAPVAILFGDSRNPYLRIDPIFMSALPGDTEAEGALNLIIRQLDEALQEVVIQAGTVCFLDNYRAVHGRVAFQAKYDGTDRWLKKLLLTNDLRKSRSLQTYAETPVLVPAMTVDKIQGSRRSWTQAPKGV